jgi:hypothetical protein
VIHERHFTVEEANGMLSLLEAALEELRGARDALTDAELHSLLADAAPANGGGRAGRQVGEAFVRVRGILLGLEQTGIVVRDIDRGLADFPAIRDGREVYLCWQRGEERIEFWHELEAGFRGRQPLQA